MKIKLYHKREMFRQKNMKTSLITFEITIKVNCDKKSTTNQIRQNSKITSKNPYLAVDTSPPSAPAPSSHSRPRSTTDSRDSAQPTGGSWRGLGEVVPSGSPACSRPPMTPIKILHRRTVWISDSLTFYDAVRTASHRRRRLVICGFPAEVGDLCALCAYAIGGVSGYCRIGGKMLGFVCSRRCLRWLEVRSNWVQVQLLWVSINVGSSDWKSMPNKVIQYNIRTVNCPETCKQSYLFK